MRDTHARDPAGRPHAQDFLQLQLALLDGERLQCVSNLIRDRKQGTLDVLLAAAAAQSMLSIRKEERLRSAFHALSGIAVPKTKKPKKNYA
jgi:hypothetical protein